MDIKIPGIVIINVKQDSRKTRIIDCLMEKYHDTFDDGIAFSTSSFNHVEEKHMFSQYDSNALKNLMDNQFKLTKQGIAKQAFVIIDIEDIHFSCPVLRVLFTTPRYHNITVILVSQHANLLPIWIRANAFRVFIFGTDLKWNPKFFFAVSCIHLSEESIGIL